MKTIDEIINEIKICEKLLENREIDLKKLGDDKQFCLEVKWLQSIIIELLTKIEVLKWVLS